MRNDGELRCIRASWTTVWAIDYACCSVGQRHREQFALLHKLSAVVPSFEERHRLSVLALARRLGNVLGTRRLLRRNLRVLGTTTLRYFVCLGGLERCKQILGARRRAAAKPPGAGRCC